jgi:carbon-monoxide dehydrogenase medium subunit
MTAVVFPETVAEAAALIESGDAEPLAGATWVMRAGIREAPAPATYVALRRIPELHEVGWEEAGLTIGACVTHAGLATALSEEPTLIGLRDAAGRSATPAVRELATVGGALGATGFAASDLLPALLALDAEVIGSAETIPLEDYVAARRGLVCAVRVPALPQRSVHRRLCLRSGGDYPVAIVDASLSQEGELRIAVGSVGPRACRWRELEHAAQRVGQPQALRELAREHADALEARDGIEAPAWYRRQVVAELAARALEEL